MDMKDPVMQAMMKKCMKAMHKDRDKRYASLKQMAQDISRLRKGQKPLYAGRSRGKSFRFWKK